MHIKSFDYNNEDDSSKETISNEICNWQIKFVSTNNLQVI